MYKNFFKVYISVTLIKILDFIIQSISDQSVSFIYRLKVLLSQPNRLLLDFFPLNPHPLSLFTPSIPVLHFGMGGIANGDALVPSRGFKIDLRISVKSVRALGTGRGRGVRPLYKKRAGLAIPASSPSQSF